MAKLCGHEAGVFLLSGTMGNQVALRSLLTQPPHSVLCDHRAHVLYLEAGGVAMLTGAMVNGVVPANGVYLTLEDIEKHVILSDDCHVCPTKVISLENTLRGMITPLKEVQKISDFARKNGIKMHLDGARLWEAVAAGAGLLSEYGACFDSMTLCY
jgi:threonine aldolase